MNLTTEAHTHVDNELPNERILMTPSKSIDQYIRAATMFYEKNQDWGKSLELFRKATEEAPDDYRGWLGILRIFTNNFQLTSGQYSSQPWWKYGVAYLGEDISSFAEKNSYLNNAFWRELLTLSNRMIAIVEETQEDDLVAIWQNYEEETLKSLTILEEKFSPLRDEIRIQKDVREEMLNKIKEENATLNELQQGVKQGIGSVLPYLKFGAIGTFITGWFYLIVIGSIWSIIDPNFIDSTPQDRVVYYWVIIIFVCSILFKVARNNNTKNKIEEHSLTLSKLKEEHQLYLTEVYNPLVEEFNDLCSHL